MKIEKIEKLNDTTFKIYYYLRNEVITDYRYNSKEAAINAIIPNSTIICTDVRIDVIDGKEYFYPVYNIFD